MLALLSSGTWMLLHMSASQLHSAHSGQPWNERSTGGCCFFSQLAKRHEHNTVKWWRTKLFCQLSQQVTESCCLSLSVKSSTIYIQQLMQGNTHRSNMSKKRVHSQFSRDEAIRSVLYNNVHIVMQNSGWYLKTVYAMKNMPIKWTEWGEEEWWENKHISLLECTPSFLMWPWFHQWCKCSVF